jgi:2-oxo-3-(phosphooxy)propyl 3-oxoalkanoate synthase
MINELHEREEPVNLSYDHTLSRKALHRRAISEVFLTDYRPLDNDDFLCGAQTPINHAYFGDQLARPETYDPLLLLECCRQSAIYDLHIRAISGTDTAAIVELLEIDLTNRGPLVPGCYPGELLLRASRSTVRAGRKGRHAFTLEMLMNGSFIGRASIRASIRATTLPSSTLRAVRRRQRPAGVILASQLPEVREGDLIHPSRVGRQNPINVVLADAALSSSGLQARVALSPRNKSILDHDYDHFPGMSIIEAGRQAGLLATESAAHGTGESAGPMHPIKLRASFIRFAELDRPLIVRAPVASAAPGQSTTRIRVNLVQDGQLVATVEITFASVATVRNK